jgi:hypothetical protein
VEGGRLISLLLPDDRFDAVYYFYPLHKSRSSLQDVVYKVPVGQVSVLLSLTGGKNMKELMGRFAVYTTASTSTRSSSGSSALQA